MKFHPNLINFFKRHNLYNKEMFTYFEHHSTMLDSNFLDERMLRCCAYQIDGKTGILQGIHLNIPYVKDEETMLDSIHELTHVIFVYPMLGKKFKKDKTIEVLPLLYEKLYILENPTKKLIEYGKHLDSLVGQDDYEYKLGLDIRDELIEKYDYNPRKTVRMVKKISRKHR